ncbi:hypothetical protein RRG08_044721 [Elysia crispata]|uniref:Uncharacterized protein n=1 Tax=Elysia crispata TaxID=231223 RepID=A0AAE0ZIS5_9GAST|nr:hypothetical protein RRG08_044721 [Elysia crispata]
MLKISQLHVAVVIFTRVLFSTCYDAENSLVCSVYCKGSLCDADTGRCTDGCVPGYNGQYCCPRDKYGPECDQRCSENCRWPRFCHSLNGRCDYGCADGFQGQFCDRKCDNGFFGPNCVIPCQVNCGSQGPLCHHVTGACNFYSECARGTYGPGCSMACSTRCGGQDNLCDPRTGHCINGCDAGFTGNQCNLSLSQQAASEESSGPNIGALVGGIIAAVVVVAVLAVVAVIIWRKRQAARRDCRLSHSENSQPHIPEPTVGKERQEEPSACRNDRPHQYYNTPIPSTDPREGRAGPAGSDHCGYPLDCLKDSSVYDTPADSLDQTECPYQVISEAEQAPPGNANDYDAGYYISLDGGHI